MKPEILNKTSADVIALCDKIAAGKVGDILTYDELSALVGRSVKPGGPAYPAMYSARKRCLRETGLVWEPLKDHTGLKCLDAEEILKLGASDMKRIGRGARRANRRLGCVDPSTLNDQQRLNLIGSRSILAAIDSASKTASIKKIEAALNGAMKPLPMGRTLDILKA